MSFTHLHTHSHYSLLDAFGSPEKYAKMTKELGFHTLAITDHGNFDCALGFQNSCDKHGIKPIFGVEFYLVKNRFKKIKGEKKYHITCLVKNRKGWKNLVKLTTESNKPESFYYKPRIDFELLLEYCKGLVIFTGCVSSYLQDEKNLSFHKELKNKLGNDLYLEVMPHELDKQKILNETCVDLGGKLVATNDCHYINQDDPEAQEVMLAIQTKKLWSDSDRWKFGDGELYLKTEREMIDSFEKQGVLNNFQISEAIQNTQEIVDKCNFRLEQRSIILPKTCDDPNGKLRSLFDKNYTKEERDRLNIELDLIAEKGFSDYFLIVIDLINWCKENDIMVGPGRGSVAGSLVAYFSGITLINPLEYGLLFERFLDRNRSAWPDIDLDFEPERTKEVIEYLRNKYGDAVSIPTFSKMKAKGIIRDVAKVFGVDLKEVGEFAKLIKDKEKKEIERVVKETHTGIEFNKKYPRVVKNAIKLEGTIKNYGKHSAGVILSDKPFEDIDRCSVFYRNGEKYCNWSMENCEYFGLLKFDILRISTLTILNEIKRLVKKNKGIDIDYRSIIPNDDDVFKEFRLGNTSGVFQANSYLQTNELKRMSPTKFEDIYACNAYCRPGPLDAGVADILIKNKNAKTLPKREHQIIDEIVKSTYGVIIYQEQVMQLANRLSGISLSDSYRMIKVIAKSKGDELEKFKDEFVTGAQKHVTKKQAEKVWSEIENFGGYAFNKSHAVAYSMLSYWCMWAKVYHPVEFLSASLSFTGRDVNEKQKLINAIYDHGIGIIPPKIGISDGFRWVVKGSDIYIPFIEIKGVGDKKAEIFAKTEYRKPEGWGFRKETIDSQDDLLLWKIGARRHEERYNKDLNDYFEFKLKEPDPYLNLKKVVGNEFFSCDLNDIVIGRLSPECKKPVIKKNGKFNVVIKGDVWNDLKKYRLSKRNFSDKGVLCYRHGNKNSIKWNEKNGYFEVIGDIEYFVKVFNEMKG